MPTRDPAKKREQLRRWVAAHPGRMYELQRRWLADPDNRAKYNATHAAWSKRTLAKMVSDPDDPRHGTRTGYSYGCRCERCASAVPRVQRNGKSVIRRPRATQPAPLAADDPRHGSNGYINFKCRCDVCREGQRLSQARYRARLKARESNGDDRG